MIHDLNPVVPPYVKGFKNMLLKIFMMLMMLNFCEGQVNTAGEEEKRREGFASEETTTNPQEAKSLEEHIKTKADDTIKSLLKRQILGIWS